MIMAALSAQDLVFQRLASSVNVLMAILGLTDVVQSLGVGLVHSLITKADLSAVTV